MAPPPSPDSSGRPATPGTPPVPQGDPAAVPVTGETWRASVAERIASLNWNAIHGDVRPFLEPGVEMVGRGELLGLLGG